MKKEVSIGTIVLIIIIIIFAGFQIREALIESYYSRADKLIDSATNYEETWQDVKDGIITPKQGLARLEENDKKFDEAEKLYNKILKIDPSYPQIYTFTRIDINRKLSASYKLLISEIELENRR